FSSRRRHTRLQGDWSSDVCSSDLDALKNDDVALKTQAAFTLAQSRLEFDKVAPIFLESLKHKTPGIRIQGLQGLGAFRNTGAGQIGRASCRERGERAGGAGAVQAK